MVILLFGPPGSGKGTQARLLSEWLRIPAVSTGDLLRAEANSGSALGQELDKLLSAGQYVPDALVNGIVLRYLNESGPGMIFDGYPRTGDQAEFLKAALAGRGLAEPVVVRLEVREAMIVERLGARRVCSACGRVYNLIQNPPKIDGVCDGCSGELMTRSDDSPEVVRQRLRTYAALTTPIFGHFRNHFVIDGDRPPAAVFSAIRQHIGETPGWVSENTRFANSPTSYAP